MDYLQYRFASGSSGVGIDVLNLIINGLPSIHKFIISSKKTYQCFKPYYKWITFNTKVNGIMNLSLNIRFKPYYKWITFNTIGGAYYYGKKVGAKF